MSAGRRAFIEELIETIESVVVDIEERESIEPDLAIARELAEQLREELETLD